MIKKTLCFLIAIAGGMIGLGSESAFAQGVGVAISPLTFELTANPGDVLQNKLRVFNPTQSAVLIQMEIEDFAVAGERGEVRIETAGSETYSLALWVKTSPESFRLEPNEQKTVDFTIEVPENAEPGGHYGSVLAAIGGVIGNEGFVGTAVSQKVGSLVLLSVSGDMVEDLRIKDFTAPEFLEYGPVPFLIRFENKGTVHVRPRGFVTITNWRDKKVVDIEFPQLNIIPGSVRKVETSWDKKWLLGKYAATLVGSYGASNNPLEPRVITFWVFPWKVAGVVSAVLLIVFTFFALTRRRWIGALLILLRGEKK